MIITTSHILLILHYVSRTLYRPFVLCAGCLHPYASPSLISNFVSPTRPHLPTIQHIEVLVLLNNHEGYEEPDRFRRCRGSCRSRSHRFSRGGASAVCHSVGRIIIIVVVESESSAACHSVGRRTVRDRSRSSPWLDRISWNSDWFRGVVFRPELASDGQTPV